MKSSDSVQESGLKRKYLILVADTAAGAGTMHSVLKDRYEYVEVHDIDAAVRALISKQFDLIICGLHFQESRMFDLLRCVRNESEHNAIPFICIRDLDSRLPEPLFESLSISCRAMGAEAFVDVYSMKAEFGDDQAIRLLLEVIEKVFANGCMRSRKRNSNLMARKTHEYEQGVAHPMQGEW